MSVRTYPSYWMYRDHRGEWRWTYDASNGRTIAVSSEGYIKRVDCRRGISLMQASANSPVFVRAVDSNAA
ncbi:DUF1508 domain-containing protein [Sphingomonas cannabina]|uniref:YegP family protein n=1 Tax=Sphingomonas cannabina TaxID=2899123 RepID=UPI001F3C5834|nr:DUF1508 domain-containing protein [Sphingomonas cannabina]UIJ45375.1 DUF1508 domain-containing protein [Sphingomonas cannabina]